MNIQLLYIDESILPELNYLCRLFSSIMEVNLSPCHASSCQEEPSGSIGYCSRELSHQLPDSCRIRIHSDDLFWKKYVQKKYPALKVKNNSGLTALNTDGYDAYFTKDEKGVSTNIDIFSSTFFIITSMEETFNPDRRDKHGRFTFAHSEWAHLYIDKPLINIYAETLLEWIIQAFALPPIVSKRRFTAVLSHDIDIPYYYGRTQTELSELSRFGKPGSKYQSFSDVKNYLNWLMGLRSDPNETFDYIMEQEGKRGIPATYFILLSKDNVWGLDPKRYSRALRKIRDAGNEIALHPGYESFHDPELISREKENLENLSGVKISGVRNHFLRFNMPSTYQVQSGLGLSYNSTMGYPDREGFRCGICLPFRPFNIEQRAIEDIIEIPLVIMDGTLKMYRQFSPEEASNSITKLVQETSAHTGVIVFNWHNTFLLKNEKSWRDVYEASLDRLVEYQAIFSTCNDIVHQSKDVWSRH